SKLAHGPARRVVDYLAAHPDDFPGAVARLQPDLARLYLSAYQSHLWNRILARSLLEVCRPEQLVTVRTRLGALPMHRNLDQDQGGLLATLTLPLPSARVKMDS